jgi:hypothetical protein
MIERNDHEKFKEFCALANSGALTAGEWAQLNGHLPTCEECRELYDQYLILCTEGIPLLGCSYDPHTEPRRWDDTATRRSLFARVSAGAQPSFEPLIHGPLAESPVPTQHNLFPWMPPNLFVGAALVGCLIAAVGLGAYHFGSRVNVGAKHAQVSSQDYSRKQATDTRSEEDLLATQKKLTHLQEESSRKEQELAKLHTSVRALERRANELMTTNSTTEEQLQEVSEERSVLNAQLRDAKQAYLNVQAELSSLRDERDHALLLVASLKASIVELSAVNREQERRLKDDEKYLAYDRDIRELMGARKLYIADVFDVDGGSRTLKPFGRVFYTQGKSLVFYAFDLDHQPSNTGASTFQAWGRMTARGGESQPVNLGVFYQDSESNRRWVLRYDDPNRLAEIDAVFVTVEPRGGSPKPTSKPFIYALLGKGTNHPLTNHP